MGQLIANIPIEVKWDKGIAKKSLSFFLRDLGGTRIKCLLWSTLAEQLYQYLEAHREDGSLIICLINNCKLRDFNGPQVSNQMYGCRVFIDQDIRPINAFKTVLEANLTSGALPPMNKDDLVLLTNETYKAKKFKDLQKVIMADVHLIKKVKSFFIRGKVDNICDSDGWFGFHCQDCKKKVQPMYCLDEDKPDYFCFKCDKEVKDVVPKVRMNISVVDKTGKLKITLFESQLSTMINKSVNWLNVAAVKVVDTTRYIDELWELIGKKFVWIIKVTDYNVLEDNYTFYTVEDSSDDPDILNSTKAAMKDDYADFKLRNQPTEEATPVDKGKGKEKQQIVDEGNLSTGSGKRKSDCSTEKENVETPTTSTASGIASLKIPRMDEL
ncbi:uncharacterized protein [Rutidosis leptorrhynchoides]|uniref:uncharacterized protein n=1 Tax=Rutidosis leptorrhynchoides TaxID=125765 RepID=UPI003A98E453